MSPSDSYTAGNLAVIEGLAAVRLRPGMYVGSSDTAGLTHCLIEIVDNAADEAAAGHAHTIGVTLSTSPLTAAVVDDGRGIPVDINEATGLSGVELVLTKLHAGGKFDGGSYATAGGLHGVGAAVVNALSTSLTATVRRDGGTYRQTFHHGVPTGPLTRIRGAAAADTGTTIEFTPDPDLFTPDATWDLDLVTTRLHHLTHLVPGLAAWLDVDGQRTDFPPTGGLADLVTAMADGAAMIGPVTMSASATFTERVSVLRDGATTVADVPRQVTVDAALAWVDGAGGMVSYVNTIPTPGGGTHLAGLERALPKVFAAAARPGDPALLREDIVENLVAVLRVQLPEPQFSGQTKQVLATRAVTGIVADAVADAVSAWLAARRNKEQAKALLNLGAGNARARIAAKEARDARRHHSKLMRAATLPAKLVDCRSRDIAENELLLVEGDSALGTVKGARDAATQAALPLRGKILNTARASEKQMLANAECAAIISVLGTGAGKNFDVGKLRYGKVILLSDADVDGAHIRCLLLTFLYRYMRPLVEQNRVFAAVPPLHMIKVGSGAKATVHYTYSDGELQEFLAQLQADGVTLRDDSIQRYKGLGEMDASQLRETTVDPAHRRLRQITMADAAAASAMFDLCMGDDAAARRDYIISRAPDLDPARLDT